jgi:di/tricarboxylate transporter
MGETEAAEMGAFQRVDKAPVALLILSGMVGGMIIGDASLTLIAMIAAVIAVLAGCLTMDEAYEGIDWKSLVLIAGMLPMSTALEKVGLASLVATTFVDILGGLGPVFILGGLFLLTAIFTQVLSNTATAVLLTPIAFAIAQDLGVSPYPLLMSVAVAASMAFASPVASPTNTLVMGAGRYTFFDYIRIGTPMLIISLIIATLVLPLLFPF